MNEAGKKPPAPPLTRFIQLLGLVSIGGGIYIFVDSTDCEELECLGILIGGILVAWGLVALLSGTRNFIGFACLIFIIVATTIMLPAAPYAIIPFVVLVAVFTRFSKGKIKEFYFSRNEVEQTA